MTVSKFKEFVAVKAEYINHNESKAEILDIEELEQCIAELTIDPNLALFPNPNDPNSWESELYASSQSEGELQIYTDDEMSRE